MKIPNKAQTSKAAVSGKPKLAEKYQTKEGAKSCKLSSNLDSLTLPARSFKRYFNGNMPLLPYKPKKNL